MNALKLPAARALLLTGSLLPLFAAIPEGHGLAPGACAENPAFQRAYFHHIGVVETYTMQRSTGAAEYTVGPDAFFASLEFIQVYAPVSMGKVLNYEPGYPDLKSFQQDKRKWLRWYRANKCRNIQLRK
jgi:hypothetical protein